MDFIIAQFLLNCLPCSFGNIVMYKSKNCSIRTDEVVYRTMKDYSDRFARSCKLDFSSITLRKEVAGFQLVRK